MKKFRAEKEKAAKTVQAPEMDAEAMQQSILQMKNLLGLNALEARVNAANEFLNKVALKLSAVCEILYKNNVTTKEDFEKLEGQLTDEFYANLENAVDAQAGLIVVARPAKEDDLVTIKYSMSDGKQVLEKDQLMTILLKKEDKNLYQTNQIIDHLVGLAAGDNKEMIISVPETEKNNQFAGKKFVIGAEVIKVKQVLPRVLPDGPDEVH